MTRGVSKAAWNREVERAFGLSRGQARGLEREPAQDRASVLDPEAERLRQEWARASARLFAVYTRAPGREGDAEGTGRRGRAGPRGAGGLEPRRRPAGQPPRRGGAPGVRRRPVQDRGRQPLPPRAARSTSPDAAGDGRLASRRPSGGVGPAAGGGRVAGRPRPSRDRLLQPAQPARACVRQHRAGAAAGRSRSAGCGTKSGAWLRAWTPRRRREPTSWDGSRRGFPSERPSRERRPRCETAGRAGPTVPPPPSSSGSIASRNARPEPRRRQARRRTPGGAGSTPAPAAGLEQRAGLFRPPPRPDRRRAARESGPQRRGGRARGPARRGPRLSLPRARRDPEQLPVLGSGEGSRRPGRRPGEARLDPAISSAPPSSSSAS